ncbi:hypothetical protein PLESTF_000028300 [Pleodorina starrii]|nr:hypothetical protein PLESTM_000205600 [Pleodorina starrii]GLC63362.1 hypothetical protein PLESTF_000028300 [Pleodorina starrii]
MPPGPWHAPVATLAPAPAPVATAQKLAPWRVHFSQVEEDPATVAGPVEALLRPWRVRVSSVPEDDPKAPGAAGAAEAAAAAVNAEPGGEGQQGGGEHPQLLMGDSGTDGLAAAPFGGGGLPPAKPWHVRHVGGSSAEDAALPAALLQPRALAVAGAGFPAAARSCSGDAAASSSRGDSAGQGPAEDRWTQGSSQSDGLPPRHPAAVALLEVLASPRSSQGSVLGSATTAGAVPTGPVAATTTAAVGAAAAATSRPGRPPQPADVDGRPPLPPPAAAGHRVSIFGRRTGAAQEESAAAKDVFVSGPGRAFACPAPGEEGEDGPPLPSLTQLAADLQELRQGFAAAPLADEAEPAQQPLLPPLQDRQRNQQQQQQHLAGFVSPAAWDPGVLGAEAVGCGPGGAGGDVFSPAGALLTRRPQVHEFAERRGGVGGEDSPGEPFLRDHMDRWRGTRGAAGPACGGGTVGGAAEVHPSAPQRHHQQQLYVGEDSGVVAEGSGGSDGWWAPPLSQLAAELAEARRGLGERPPAAAAAGGGMPAGAGAPLTGMHDEQEPAGAAGTRRHVAGQADSWGQQREAHAFRGAGAGGGAVALEVEAWERPPARTGCEPHHLDRAAAPSASPSPLGPGADARAAAAPLPFSLLAGVGPRPAAAAAAAAAAGRPQGSWEAYGGGGAADDEQPEPEYDDDDDQLPGPMTQLIQGLQEARMGLQLGRSGDCGGAPVGAEHEATAAGLSTRQGFGGPHRASWPPQSPSPLRSPSRSPSRQVPQAVEQDAAAAPAAAAADRRSPTLAERWGLGGGDGDPGSTDAPPAKPMVWRDGASSSPVCGRPATSARAAAAAAAARNEGSGAWMGGGGGGGDAADGDVEPSLTQLIEGLREARQGLWPPEPPPEAGRRPAARAAAAAAQHQGGEGGGSPRDAVPAAWEAAAAAGGGGGGGAASGRRPSPLHSALEDEPMEAQHPGDGLARVCRPGTGEVAAGDGGAEGCASFPASWRTSGGPSWAEDGARPLPSWRVGGGGGNDGVGHDAGAAPVPQPGGGDGGGGAAEDISFSELVRRLQQQKLSRGRDEEAVQDLPLGDGGGGGGGDDSGARVAAGGGISPKHRMEDSPGIPTGVSGHGVGGGGFPADGPFQAGLPDCEASRSRLSALPDGFLRADGRYNGDNGDGDGVGADGCEGSMDWERGQEEEEEASFQTRFGMGPGEAMPRQEGSRSDGDGGGGLQQAGAAAAATAAAQTPHFPSGRGQGHGTDTGRGMASVPASASPVGASLGPDGGHVPGAAANAAAAAAASAAAAAATTGSGRSGRPSCGGTGGPAAGAWRQEAAASAVAPACVAGATPLTCVTGAGNFWTGAGAGAGLEGTQATGDLDQTPSPSPCPDLRPAVLLGRFGPSPRSARGLATPGGDGAAAANAVPEVPGVGAGATARTVTQGLHDPRVGTPELGLPCSPPVPQEGALHSDPTDLEAEHGFNTPVASSASDFSFGAGGRGRRRCSGGAESSGGGGGGGVGSKPAARKMSSRTPTLLSSQGRRKRREPKRLTPIAMKAAPTELLPTKERVAAAAAPAAAVAAAPPPDAGRALPKPPGARRASVPAHAPALALQPPRCKPEPSQPGPASAPGFVLPFSFLQDPHREPPGARAPSAAASAGAAAAAAADAMAADPPSRSSSQGRSQDHRSYPSQVPAHGPSQGLVALLRPPGLSSQSQQHGYGHSQSQGLGALLYASQQQQQPGLGLPVLKAEDVQKRRSQMPWAAARTPSRSQKAGRETAGTASASASAVAGWGGSQSQGGGGGGGGGGDAMPITPGPWLGEEDSDEEPLDVEALVASGRAAAGLQAAATAPLVPPPESGGTGSRPLHGEGGGAHPGASGAAGSGAAVGIPVGLKGELQGPASLQKAGVVTDGCGAGVSGAASSTAPGWQPTPGAGSAGAGSDARGPPAARLRQRSGGSGAAPRRVTSEEVAAAAAQALPADSQPSPPLAQPPPPPPPQQQQPSVHAAPAPSLAEATAALGSLELTDDAPGPGPAGLHGTASSPPGGLAGGDLLTAGQQQQPQPQEQGRGGALDAARGDGRRDSAARAGGGLMEGALVIIDRCLPRQHAEACAAAVEALGGRVSAATHLGCGATAVVCGHDRASRWLAWGAHLVSPRSLTRLAGGPQVETETLPQPRGPPADDARRRSGGAGAAGAPAARDPGASELLCFSRGIVHSLQRLLADADADGVDDGGDPRDAHEGDPAGGRRPSLGRRGGRGGGSATHAGSGVQSGMAETMAAAAGVVPGGDGGGDGGDAGGVEDPWPTLDARRKFLLSLKASETAAGTRLQGLGLAGDQPGANQPVAPLSLLDHLVWTLTQPPEQAQLIGGWGTGGNTDAGGGGEEARDGEVLGSGDGDDEDGGNGGGSCDGFAGMFQSAASQDCTPWGAGFLAADGADGGGSSARAAGGRQRSPLPGGPTSTRRGEPRPVGPRDLDTVVFTGPRLTLLLPQDQHGLLGHHAITLGQHGGSGSLHLHLRPGTGTGLTERARGSGGGGVTLRELLSVIHQHYGQHLAPGEVAAAMASHPVLRRQLQVAWQKRELVPRSALLGRKVALCGLRRCTLAASLAVYELHLMG